MSVLDDLIDYQRIDEIVAKISDVFYYAFLGELISVFGPEYYKADGMYEFNSGTGGWLVAMTMACKKLDMQWILESYNEMAWYDSDTLDGIIEEKLCCILADFDGHCNPYYKYIIENKDKEKER